MDPNVFERWLGVLHNFLGKVWDRKVWKYFKNQLPCLKGRGASKQDAHMAKSVKFTQMDLFVH